MQFDENQEKIIELCKTISTELQEHSADHEQIHQFIKDTIRWKKTLPIRIILWASIPGLVTFFFFIVFLFFLTRG